MTDGLHTRDDEALPPEEMLALVRDQQRSMEGQIAAFVPVVLLGWGVAWLLGFGALWLIDGLRPAFALPSVAAAVIAGALFVGAIALSAVLGIRSGRGVRRDGPAVFSGVVYGCTWTLGVLAIVVFGWGLRANGMDVDLAGVFFAPALALFTGLMFVLGAAIWRAVPMLVLGVWLMIVAVTAPFFGHPTLHLVLAVGGGAGFLVLAAVSARHLAHLRRPKTGGRRG
ncbi:hypothetical protein [Microbacterium sp. PMB16]|uniref:hypothetical protein n=1 Tax=Microbacterium sp. PMB16 TaxID=3120157 RepID=UPI003F4B3854